MITDLDSHLIGMAIGIRFRTNFKVEDHLGAIVDSILHQKDSAFGTDVFPEINISQGQRVLINEKNKNQMVIDNANFILDIRFDKMSGFAATDWEKIAQKFEKQILNGTMLKFGIQRVQRAGIIKRFLFKSADLASTFVDKTIGHSLGGVNDINLRFTKKIPLPDALVVRDVNDWGNVIFEVVKANDVAAILMNIDYQLHYSPVLESPKDLKFQTFIKNSDAYMRNDFLNWLNSNFAGIQK